MVRKLLVTALAAAALAVGGTAYADGGKDSRPTATIVSCSPAGTTVSWGGNPAFMSFNWMMADGSTNSINVPGETDGVQYNMPPKNVNTFTITSDRAAGAVSVTVRLTYQPGRSAEFEIAATGDCQAA